MDDQECIVYLESIKAFWESKNLKGTEKRHKVWIGKEHIKAIDYAVKRIKDGN